MDTIGTADRIVQFALRWPALLSIVVAGAAAHVLVVVVERFLLPEVHDPAALRTQRGIVFLITAALAMLLTASLWAVLVPDVPLVARLVVSGIAAILTAAAYPILGRIATSRWPDIGSAWRAL